MMAASAGVLLNWNCMTLGRNVPNDMTKATSMTAAPASSAHTGLQNNVRMRFTTVIDGRGFWDFRLGACADVTCVSCCDSR